MIDLVPFVGILLLLLTEGMLIVYCVLREPDWKLLFSLALPLAALTNVLIIALYTVTTVALTPTSLITAHGLLVTIAALCARKLPALPSSNHAEHSIGTARILTFLSGAVLACIAVYSIVHGMMLPTFQFDSLTNWTMRSQISFVDQRMAFDPTEARGMAKPQYPYLFHALQISANQGNAWNDALANLILVLLGFSSVIALWLILRRLLSRNSTLITVALIFGTPLLATHMAQGYADSVLIQYVLLAHASLIVWVMQRESRWLTLSAVMVAASVWTKSEGLIFGLIPWLLTVGFIGWTSGSLARVRFPLVLSLVLGLSWTVGAIFAGLSLTPHHGSDASLSLSTQAMREAVVGLFSRGSFGIAWYAALLGLLLFFAERKLRRHRAAPTLLMAGITFVIILLIYTVTPNSQFLLKGESYYRQMLLPLGLLILSLAVLFTTHPDDQNDEQNPAAETQSPF